MMDMIRAAWGFRLFLKRALKPSYLPIPVDHSHPDVTRKSKPNEHRDIPISDTEITELVLPSKAGGKRKSLHVKKSFEIIEEEDRDSSDNDKLVESPKVGSILT